MYFLFKEFCNFCCPAELDLFPWSQIRQPVENKEFQGPADIFKAIAKRAGLTRLTERSTTQQRAQWGRITAFLLRVVCPLCAEHADTCSPLNTAARASQWKKVYLDTVKVETVCAELWRQFQALFLFHPYQLVAAGSKLPFSCPCSFSCLFLHMPTLCFQFRTDKGRCYLKKFFFWLDTRQSWGKSQDK